MSFFGPLLPYFTSYYVLNTLASIAYIVLKTVHPFCNWLFMGEESCQLSMSDCETLVFVGVVMAFKNSKWKRDANREVFGMATGFFKAVNLILFLRSNFPLFVFYGVFCIVLFVAVPESIYSGPDSVQLFSAASLEEELQENDQVTYLVEFYTMWSPPCKRISEPFAEVSLKFDHEYLRFGKIDLGRYPMIARKYNIDDSVSSKQLPTLILFQDGKEIKRRPTKSVGPDGKVKLFGFTKENIIKAFGLETCLETAKAKLKREQKRNKTDERKKEN
ncbi:thioredoxin-related transmembrane protein 2-like [Xenia sp. Carnegie-2017]|uniref:thioredoxin-related transmembrane protein 2-like n=1 Tax=Xenia sp. Carnegie-2017 TaxID=2897299 RepID=UPI001F0372BA|nr:thioredoxin-related transmembrane protein 2-like [Xenia sp. Carnegie-2017]